MAAAATVFSVAIGEQAAIHHFLHIGLYVFIHKVGMESFELFPMVLEYLDEPVFVINRPVV